ncbi:DgyrCDS8443 [Dimorphilus gyrociliatus]|uniref:DNA polymerase alpha subunit B n=1 Tax=Dimorphilus gyrociliatus TaxID=2664684 RepID=A0A7I8VU55_9ANNE|nr:DgyrCDS8443 [Dimorphilus gyrociliatus]
MSSFTRETLEEELHIFGFSLENDGCFEKVRDLAMLHGLDEEGITNEFVAFTHTSKLKHNSQLTEVLLLQFERERLSKKAHKQAKTPLSKNKIKREAYDDSCLDDSYNAFDGETKKSVNSPANFKQSGSRNYSTITQSPSCTDNYTKRNNSGDIICKFGSLAPKEVVRKESDTKISFLIPEEEMNRLDKFMFQKNSDKSMVVNDILEETSSLYKLFNNIEHFGHVSLPLQEKTTICGRIVSEGESKLNSSTVLIQGSLETSGGRCCKLDLSNLNKYSLFPGQIVAFEGVNNNGRSFVASKILESLWKNPEEVLLKDDMKIIISAGPYATNSSDLEPFHDLIQVIKRENPDICIMMGPFVDCKNQNLMMQNKSYEDIFSDMMKYLRQEVEGLHTKFFIIPSERDAHHDMVYPQNSFSLKSDEKNLRYLMNPGILDCDGLILGYTSTDIIIHMASEEIASSNHPEDKVTRVLKHILQQKQFYPLNPPHHDINIEYEMLEYYGKISVTPHILITPSDLKYFIKEINGTLCINPGRLARGNAGGTYGKALLKGDAKSKLNLETMRFEIIRI